MIRRRRTTICREGWYYLAVLAFVVTGAVLRDINLLMIMAGMMLGPLLLGWRMAVLGLRPLQVTRRAPSIVGAGDLVVVDIAVRSAPAPLPRMALSAWAVTVADTLRPERATGGRSRLPANVFFWRVRRGELQRVSYRGRLARRGRYRFGPLTVSSRFPLGLVRRTLALDAPHALLVLPRLGRLTPAWQRFYQQSLSGSPGRLAKQAIVDGDFHGLRDWRPGDARRQIHWRTSARRRAPVVRQFEQQRSRDLVLLLDLWTVRGAAKEDDEAVERAVSFAATVVNDVCRRGGSRLVLGVAGGTATTVRGAASIGLLHECQAELAVAEAGDGKLFDKLLDEALNRLRPAASLVVVSTRRQAADTASPLDGLLADPRCQGVRRVMRIDARGDDLAEYCSWE